MGKHKHDWPEAKKLCRLNQNDIAMAKRLGFRPDALVRARPDPKQKWKLPVKDWIHELHLKRFGHVLGETLIPAPQPTARPTTPEEDEEAARIFGEQLYWEDYWDRNRDETAGKPKRGKPTTAPATTPGRNVTSFAEGITDDDVPF